MTNWKKEIILFLLVVLFWPISQHRVSGRDQARFGKGLGKVWEGFREEFGEGHRQDLG